MVLFFSACTVFAYNASLEAMDVAGTLSLEDSASLLLDSSMIAVALTGIILSSFLASGMMLAYAMRHERIQKQREEAVTQARRLRWKSNGLGYLARSYVNSIDGTTMYVIMTPNEHNG